MTEPGLHRRRPWWRSGRGAAIGAGLCAAVTLSPLVWGQTATQPAVPPAAATSQLPPQSFAPLVKRVLPAVVNISVTEKPDSEQMSEQSFQSPEAPFDQFLRRFFEQHGGIPHGFSGQPNEGGAKRIALGSGFIIDSSGYVVTNNHVIGQAERVEVILQNGDKFRAKIIGRDPRTDLALLKIDADHPLPFVSWGNSNAAQVGDWVIAVGNPFGLGGSVTTGIISARGRDIHEGQFDDFLQIDAPINRGNSGGPTFDLQGQVIGINTAIYSPNGGSVGIGFAIPSSIASQVVSELRAHGKVERGWLGVQIQEVTPAIAASLGLERDAGGALVAVVTANSAAAKAGLKQGDVVLAFNGTKVKKLRDLSRLVAATAPNSASTITVWRDHKSLTLNVTVGEAPENPQIASATQPQGEQNADEASALGMHFAPLTAELRRELGVGRDVKGVVITEVDNGSLADNLGFSRGDIVQEINQRPVASPEQAAETLKSIAHSSHKDALLLLYRNGVTQYVGIKIDKEQG